MAAGWFVVSNPFKTGRYCVEMLNDGQTYVVQWFQTPSKRGGTA